MKNAVKTIDSYIAAQPEAMRPLLEEIRSVIRRASPDAEETISYNMPVFKFHGMLVGFAAWKSHCGFYSWNGHTVAEFKKELEGYKTSAGAIQLPLNEKLPVALLSKIVKARMRENVRKSKGKASRQEELC